MNQTLKTLKSRHSIYIAGKFTARDRLRDHRDLLRTLGVRVSSNWMDSLEDSMPLPEMALTEAIRDMAEVRAADLLIIDTIDESMTGGREVELGITLGNYTPVWLVGPKRNIFHYMASPINRYESWEHLFRVALS